MPTTLLDRHLLAETGKLLTAILLVISLILLSVMFMRFLQAVTLGDLNANAVLELAGLQVIRYLGRILPPAYFITIILVLGRMYRDSEMVALAACGTGMPRIYRAFLITSLPLMLLTGLLSLYLQPWSARQIDAIWHQQKQNINELAGLGAGRFNEYSQGDLVFYLESSNEQASMQNIFVQHRQHGDLGIVVARSGMQELDPITGDRILHLNRGHRYEGNPGDGAYTLAEFERFSYRIFNQQDGPETLRRSGTPSSVLYRSGDLKDRAELQYRLSYPVSVFTLAILAIPLSRAAPRVQVYGRLFMAFLAYFFFLNLQTVSRSWMEDGSIPEWVGPWWVHLVTLLLAAAIITFDSYAIQSRLARWNNRKGRAETTVTAPTGEP
jgi:lipopolysaccharide export system permease protein